MKKLNTYLKAGLFSAAVSLISVQSANAQSYDTEEIPMMRGVTKNIKNGWETDALFTVGETDNDGTDYALTRFGYRPPGVLDGMYAFQKGNNKIDLLVNHELRDERGYPYKLESGAVLTGARVSKFRVRQNGNGKRKVKSVGLAYSVIYDRYYQVVSDAAQLNEGANPGSNDGLDRLCSANGIEKNKFGFKKNIFLTGEETGGGQEFALDVNTEKMYCVPAMGRAAWESVCVMENFGSNKVVVLIGDDRGGAPLLLYIGEKGASNGLNEPKFLRNNGLAKGIVMVWRTNNGDLDPEAWNGTFTSRSGEFVPINIYQPSMAGQEGFDLAGWADQDTQDQLGFDVNRFNFSRPEDVHTNPNDGTQAVMASTGRPSLYPSDSWGTTYLIDLDAKKLQGALSGPLNEIKSIPAELTILYDGDDAGAGQFSDPDFGLRSPDNLTWADDGYIYLNEDRSIGDFCLTSGIEASVWQLNPNDGGLTRILEMDRNAVPFRQTDSAPLDCGNWESSGTIDVTSFFNTRPNETLLLLNVQAHSNDNAVNPNSPIGGDDDLSEGGQLLFASKIVEPIGNKVSYDSLYINNEKPEADKPLPVYPNPASEVVNLREEANAKVYNALGYLVIDAGTTKSIDVSGLEPGIYYIKTDKEESFKVIIK